MKTSGKQSKRRNLQLKWLHRETNDIHFIIIELFAFHQKDNWVLCW